MILFSCNRVKQIIACFFFGLFLFIYAEKALHEHSGNKTESKAKGIVQFTNKNACNICEYQLSKVLEVNVPVAVIKPIFSILISYTFNAPQINSLSVSSAPGRAPPHC